MVFNMKRKEIILGVLGIVVIVVIAFFVANFIHNSNQEKISNNDNISEKEEDKQLKVDGVEINFKSYRVDQSFFLNVPDTFIMLDEETLKTKYNYNNRPELVFMSEDDTEHIYISTTNEDMTDDGLESYLNSRVASLSNMTVMDNGIYNSYDKTFAKLVTNDGITYYNITRTYVLKERRVLWVAKEKMEKAHGVQKLLVVININFSEIPMGSILMVKQRNR